LVGAIVGFCNGNTTVGMPMFIVGLTIFIIVISVAVVRTAKPYNGIEPAPTPVVKTPVPVQTPPLPAPQIQSPVPASLYN
jgi:hypothetical protein